MENRSVLECPVEYDKTNMLDLLSLSAGQAFLRQNRMGERIIGDSGWGLNPSEGIIRFGDKEFKAGILGSESYIQNTWLWSWAHTESGLPEKAVAVSHRAKKRLPDLPEFQNGKFMLDELHTGHNLSMITCGTSSENLCYYRCPYDGGAAFVVIYGLPEEIFAPADLQTFFRQYVEIIRGFYCDHRLLAAGFLFQNGTRFTETHGEIHADFSSGELHLQFEEVEGMCRVVNISVNPNA